MHAGFTIVKLNSVLIDHNYVFYTTEILYQLTSA